MIRLLAVDEDNNVVTIDIFFDEEKNRLTIGRHTIVISGSYIDFPSVAQPSANAGRLYYNSSDKSFYYYNGSSWVKA